ncbi:protein phosphatase 1 regulatory subunit 14B isoform X2 [Arctopsyche grandis]|uniref:protein phosphatase 1 regulatory subunit 14B isoform X2 n=1 Tax=Arctopsyche grandis TaxID=121162 RepID=UPI00406D861A
MSLFFKFRNSRAAAGAGAQCGMECGVAAAGFGGAAPAPAPASILSPTKPSPAKTGLSAKTVNFIDKGEVKERREKFLTAKYGSHQMALIRKRLAVEMWLYDELQKLYDIPKDNVKTFEVDVDIDELLDMDSDEYRRHHLHNILADAKKPKKDVNKFINELLEKAKTL